jgi:histidine ammonia-lyase
MVLRQSIRPERARPAGRPRAKSHQGQEAAVIRVDGRTLRCADVVTAAATVGPLPIDVSTAALRAAEHAWKLAEELSTRRVFYGRTTGVGANEEDAVDDRDSIAHGKRVTRLRS